MHTEPRPPAGPGRPGRPGPVVTLGAHILDVLGRPVESIPPGQGSARLAEIRATAAGTAAGAAVDLARLGADVRTIGAIGDDLLGDMVTAALARAGVGTGGLVRKAGAQTSATILPIRRNGERPALHVPGATSLLAEEDIDPGAIVSCRALLIGGPDALGRAACRTWLPRVAAAARASGALVVVDVLHPGGPEDLAAMRGVLAAADWFCPNGDQLLALTGRGDLDAAIGDVLALGARSVAVTLGARGCVVAADGARDRVPAIPVTVVDTTGCGDAFNAGLIAGLLLGCAPGDAARLGVACGALVATGLGSDAGLRSLDQVIGLLDGHDRAAARRIRAAAGGTEVR